MNEKGIKIPEITNVNDLRIDLYFNWMRDFEKAKKQLNNIYGYKGGK